MILQKKKKADCTFSALIKEINQKKKNKIIENLRFPNAKTLIKIGWFKWHRLAWPITYQSFKEVKTLMKISYLIWSVLIKHKNPLHHHAKQKTVGVTGSTLTRMIWPGSVKVVI